MIGEVTEPKAIARMSLVVKLYPMNELANQTDVLTRQVSNMMNGNGRFTFDYRRDTLDISVRFRRDRRVAE